MGQTVQDPRLRLGQHVYASKKGKSYLCCWVKSLGAQGLRPTLEIVQKDVPVSLLDEYEIRLIAWHRAQGTRLVNHSEGGGGVRGYSPSEETRAKLSKANRGRKHTLEARKRISEGNKGKTHSPETIAKISNTRKGSAVSGETREKLSKALKGRVFSEEHKAKIGLSHRGRKFSEETKEKIRIARTGTKASKEAKENMSKKHKGTNNARALFSDADVMVIRCLYYFGFSGPQVATMFGRPHSSVFQAISGLSWTHLPPFSPPKNVTDEGMFHFRVAVREATYKRGNKIHPFLAEQYAERVLSLYSQGKSNAEICRIFGLDKRTVRTFIRKSRVA